jgi:shikimate dehydrogenase
VKLGILGWPVAHSLSPRMHTAALRAVGLTDWTYELLPTPPEQLPGRIAALRDGGWRGVNVTIPHKQAARGLVDGVTAEVETIGALNTIVVDGARLFGHNTDAPGFLDAAGDVRGLHCAVLGAGGSSRAVQFALAQAGVAQLRVVTRANWTAEAIASCELLVGCVPPDATPPPLDRVADGARVIDLVYYGKSALAGAARVRGLRYEDGLEVLVRQGARSFELWTGKAAPLEVMREAVQSAEDRQHEPS